MVADKAGWGKAPSMGQAMGIAYVESFSTRVAEVAVFPLKDATSNVSRGRSAPRITKESAMLCETTCPI